MKNKKSAERKPDGRCRVIRMNRCLTEADILRSHRQARRGVAVTVLLHPKAVGALDELALRGLHGIGRDGVAQRLVEAGLRAELVKR